LARLSVPRRWIQSVRTAAQPVARLRTRQRVSTTWLLPGLLIVLCLPTTGWLFSNGTAASAWLVIDIAIAVIGVPVALVVMRLFGYEDRD
jgi:cation transport ATPase